jgi:hypothetical protein
VRKAAVSVAPTTANNNQDDAWRREAGSRRGLVGRRMFGVEFARIWLDCRMVLRWAKNGN